MGLGKTGSFHGRDREGGAGIMSTPLTNEANRARAYDFLLPTFGFGDALVSFRPDPFSTLTKDLSSSIVNNAVPGARIAQIYRDGSGATVLGGVTQDRTGALVPAEAVPLIVEKRPELVPADQIPGGAPAPTDISGSKNMGLATGGPSSAARLSQRRVNTSSLLGRVKTAAQSGPGKAWILSAIFAGGLLFLLLNWRNE